MKQKKILKIILWTALYVFILMNVAAFFQSYRFTHYSNTKNDRTQDASKISGIRKLDALILGVHNPRPLDTIKPVQKYSILYLQSNKMIECWSIKRDSAKGTVILFHGYGGSKSSLIERSDEFLKMGYNTFLVDFMGSGGSEGNQTTIGYKEAAEVKTAFKYLADKNEKNIYLFGVSLGAAAILKAMSDFQLNPQGIILECPFGSMYKTTCARFHIMKVPAFPMAGLLVFWGGIQNGFWAFDHNPEVYATRVNCPVILIYGYMDKKVSWEETECIYSNLKGVKKLICYPLAGHDDYFVHYKQQWTEDLKDFLFANSSK
jgi:uncharacterized protein